MIQPRNNELLGRSQQARDEAWQGVRQACAGESCPETPAESVKSFVDQHPFLTFAIVAGSTAVAARVIRKLPIRAVGATALTLAAQFYLPGIVRGMLEKRGGPGKS